MKDYPICTHDCVMGQEGIEIRILACCERAYVHCYVALHVPVLGQPRLSNGFGVCHDLLPRWMGHNDLEDVPKLRT